MWGGVLDGVGQGCWTARGRGGNVGRGRRGRDMCGTGAGRRGEGTRVLDGVMCAGSGCVWASDCATRERRKRRPCARMRAPACNFFRICESLGPSVSVFSSIRAHNPRWVFRKHPQGLTYPEKIALQARKTSGMHAPWPALQTRERTGRPELRGGRSRGYGIVWRESKSAPEGASIMNGGDAQIRTGGEGFAGLCLTTWPRRQTLSSRKRPAKLLQYSRPSDDRWSGRRGSNPRPRPWQGRALPAEPRPRREEI